MKSVRRLLAAAFGLGVFVLLGQTTTGVPPQASPADYPASATTANAGYGASLLSGDHVKHIFPVDISKNYLVFEVACYPGKDGKLTVDPDDFVVQTGAKSEFVHPVDAVTVASSTQDKSAPPRASRSNTDVVVGTTVGYESGTDPYTGRRIHGVYTDSSVGVGVGGPPPPPYPPPSGSNPDDRRMLETLIARKALPGGQFTSPVAGYLFFPARELKKNGQSTYGLAYLGDSSGKVKLDVPIKTH